MSGCVGKGFSLLFRWGSLLKRSMLIIESSIIDFMKWISLQMMLVYLLHWQCDRTLFWFINSRCYICKVSPSRQSNWFIILITRLMSLSGSPCFIISWYHWGKLFNRVMLKLFLVVIRKWVYLGAQSDLGLHIVSQGFALWDYANSLPIVFNNKFLFKVMLIHLFR
jgi:hypothetical protein